MSTYAQPFSNNISGGCYLTSLNLFFRSGISTSVSGSNNVTVDIREMINGQPRSNGHLKGSRVSIPLPDSKKSNDASIPLNFLFENPVYIDENKKYCFTINTSNRSQSLWFAANGEMEINNDNVLNTNELTEIFVQSGSSWNKMEGRSIKYELYRAKFPVSRAYSYYFKPANYQYPVRLAKDPIRVFKGSDIAVVNIPNNGCIKNNSRITISGSDEFAGLVSNVLNRTHTVISASTDSVMIRLLNTATTSIVGGGSNVTTTKNYPFDKFISLFNYETPRYTSIDWAHKLNNKSSTSYSSSSDLLYFNSDNYVTLENQKVILNSSTKTEAGLSAGEIRCDVLSRKDNLSPIIDLDNTSIAISKNRVNNPDAVNRFKIVSADSPKNTSGQTTIRVESITNGIFGVNTFLQASDLENFLVFGYGIPNESTISAITPVGGGFDNQYDITLSSNLTDDLDADNVILVHGTDSTKDYVLNYSDGTGSDRSSALSKYITKRVDLETAAPILKIILEVNLPTEADIKVYAKTTPYNDADFDSLEWKLVNPEDSEQGVPKTNDPNRFIRVEYEYSNTASNGQIENFISFSVKMEMFSSDSTKIPRVKNIKAIAVT